MCMLALCKERKMTYEEFNNSYDSNKDGVGFAYIKEGKNFFIKGFITKDEAWAYYKARINKLPHVVHFRTGTLGGTLKSLTHPFIIDKNQIFALKAHTDSPLLFHNGVIAGHKDMIFQLAMHGIKVISPYSDTSIFALILYILRKTGYSWKEIFSDIRFIEHGKYIIMDDETYHIYGEFEKENGIYFSNTGYKTYKWKGYYNKSLKVQRYNTKIKKWVWENVEQEDKSKEYYYDY